MTSFRSLLSKDLTNLYSIIYSNAKDLNSQPAAAFIAFNSLHMHREAINMLKILINNGRQNIIMCLSESPLYSILLPIVADEYGVDLFGFSEFANMFDYTLDNIINSGEGGVKTFCDFIPSNYILGHIRGLLRRKDNGSNIKPNAQLSRLLELFEEAFPDHFSNPRTYLGGLIDLYRRIHPTKSLAIPVDSTFFRTFGHSIFQPDWLAREFSIASSSLAGIRILPLFIVPDHTSLLGIRNSTLSNRYILDAWVEIFRYNSDFGKFSTMDEFKQTYDEEKLGAMLPYHYSLSEAFTNNVLISYNENASSIYERTKYSIHFDLGHSLRCIGGVSAAPRISKRKTAILHVRSSAFYGDCNHRNSNILNYQSLCNYLYRNGYEVYNYSNPDPDVNNIRSIFNYNDLKSKKLDALLVSTADLIVSTPSGVGATGRLFGVNELVTNFWPYLFDGVPSKLSLIPKIVVDCRSRQIVGLAEVLSLSSSFGSDYFEKSEQYEICENTDRDLLLGIDDFLNGRMVQLNTFLEGTNAIVPQSFISNYFPME